ncbi:hypothetical protein JL49_16525 [Pseudoalteromonas luteoviolacea]|nr:hypothetical protein JL49_16525 [Pseudoalteromonas luteoviolacea]
MTVENTAHLSDAQKQLLEQFTKGQQIAAEQPIASQTEFTEIRLTSSQMGMWLVNKLDPDSTAYNTYTALKFARPVEKGEIETAIVQLMKRYDALNIEVFEQNEEPYQRIVGDLKAPLIWHDFSELALEEARTEAERVGNLSVSRPFSLDEVPLFRVVAMNMPDDTTLVTFVFHHIIVDGWSLGILYDDFAKLLFGKSLAEAPEQTFLNYVGNKALTAHSPEQDIEYWTNKLGGDLSVLDLPKDRPRVAAKTKKGGVVNFEYDAEFARSVKQVAERLNVTAFEFYMTVYNVLMHRLTGQKDIVVGAPFACRDDLGVENMVGCFVNTMALRTQFSGDETFEELLENVHQNVGEALTHQSVPFEKVVSKLKVKRDVQYNPVFQTMFAYDESLAGLEESEGVSKWEIELDSESAKFDITVQLTQEPSGNITAFFEYALGIFDHDTVERFVQIYTKLLQEIVKDTKQKIFDLPIVAEEEASKIIWDLNPYEKPSHSYKTMTEPFEEQVARAPHNIALVSGSISLTYDELNRKSNQLAHYLKSNGVSRNDYVSLCMDRSIDMFITLYAICKVGACYVPLDPEIPAARIQYILEEAKPSFLFVDSKNAAKITDWNGPIINTETDSAQWSDQLDTNFDCGGSSRNLIHLLYTSGSTGRPKAVEYQVDGAIAELLWLHKSYPLVEGGANIFKTSYGFDVSIWEIFWTLYFGAKLVIPEIDKHKDPHHIISLVNEHKVTTLFMIPAMLEAMLEQVKGDSCSTLEWILCGGAPVTPRIRELSYKKLKGKLINCFGPTEAGCVTDMEIQPEFDSPVVPLGRPAANFRLYVLDDDRKVLPVGVPGNVYLAGEVGLSRGYYAQAAMTAEHFVPDPYGEPGSRMYNTGDICRYRNDGVLEHLGRAGNQVKILGMRVELGEIESILGEIEWVETCSVIAHKVGGRETLIAYVVPYDKDIAVGMLPDDMQREVKMRLAVMLPGHMIPPHFIVMDKIPLNLNGKVDRAKLLASWDDLGVNTDKEVVQPENEREVAMKEIFEELLECQDISVTDSFFDLGGNSLLVFKLAFECDEKFGKRPSFTDIFTYPTVRELSAMLDDLEEESCLAPIYPDASKPMFVFIHAASGVLFPFLKVSEYLKEAYSVYVLQSPTKVPSDMPFTTIEDMANYYKSLIDNVRGNSPVIIAGWSMGGCVGLEMSRKWHEEGVDIASTIMIDTWMPPELLDDRSEAEFVVKVIDETDVLGDEARALNGEEAPAQFTTELQQIVDLNKQVFIEYKPEAYPHEVDYLVAQERLVHDGRTFSSSYSKDEDWSKFLVAMECHSIPGNHYTIFDENHSPKLAETLLNIVESRLAFETL